MHDEEVMYGSDEGIDVMLYDVREHWDTKISRMIVSKSSFFPQLLCRYEYTHRGTM